MLYNRKKRCSLLSQLVIEHVVLMGLYIEIFNLSFEETTKTYHHDQELLLELSIGGQLLQRETFSVRLKNSCNMQLEYRI